MLLEGDLKLENKFERGVWEVVRKSVVLLEDALKIGRYIMECWEIDP